MARDLDLTPENSESTGTSRVKRGMAEMLKGGVIMDVVTAEQAKIAASPTRSRVESQKAPNLDTWPDARAM